MAAGSNILLLEDVNLLLRKPNKCFVYCLVILVQDPAVTGC